MKRKNKKKIAGFFKKPVIIIIIIAVTWAIFTGISTSFILSRLKRELVASSRNIYEDLKNKYVRGRTVVEDIAILNQLKVKEVKCYLSASGKEEIVQGTVINDSDKRLGRIRINLTFLNSAGEPIAECEYENAVKVIEAKNSAGFSVLRVVADKGESALTAEKRRSSSVKGTVSDFEVIE